jgi:hypothetical protein
MAENWGDIIGRGYVTGRALGNDVAQLRFNRRAEKLRSEYEQRAREEGKDLADFMPEIEDRLRETARAVGASRRGLKSDEVYLADLSPALTRGTNRRAGALALEGNQAGARDTLARGAYNMGDFDGGQTQQIAGDTIRATTGALRPDGTYDAARGAQALSGTAARYGDGNMAAQQGQSATTFSLQVARAKGGALLNMIQNPGAFTPDQVAGVWEGLKENVPLMANIDLRLGEDGVFYIYTGGKRSGSIDPNNPDDVEQAVSMLNSFTKDPAATLNDYVQMQIQNATRVRERSDTISDDFRKARIEVAQNLVDKGVPADVAQALIRAQTSLSGSGSGGWQLQDIGDEPGTYVMQKNGQVYVIKTNVEPNLETGEVGGTLQVIDPDTNQPVPASVLNRREQQQITSVLADLTAAQQQANYKLRAGSIGDSLRLLNSLQEQEMSSEGLPMRGRAPRGLRNNNAGNIKDVGQFRGDPDYVGTDDKGFAQFRTPEAGQRAAERQLQRYMRGEGVAGRPRTTVQDIVSLWSPQSDPGNEAGSTANYARYVAARLGVSPTDQLSEADIPRLVAAMSEFENGNTQRGVMTADAGAPQGEVAQGAVDTPRQVATAAGSAPSAIPGTRRAITRESLQGAATDARGAAEQVRTARAALQRFDEEQGVTMGRPGGATGSYLTAEAIPTGLSAAQRRVRARLERDLQMAERRAREAALSATDLARTASTLRDNQQSRREEDELYARYGGAADFFRAAGGSR